MFGTTLLALLALFVVFAVILVKVEKLTLFGPGSTRGIATSAAAFCADQCRLTDGRCPMTGSRERALNCALWKFVEADVPTVLYGSPFTGLQTGSTSA